MHYTPNDLQNLIFKKNVVGGYNEDIVNEVLDKIIEDYNLYIRENIELRDKLTILNEGLQRYKNIEESLQNALVSAQQTGEDIKKNAYEKAENIVKEAELKVEQRLSHANDEIIKITFQYEEVRKKMYVYKAKAESLLISQLELLKQSIKEVDKD